MKLKFDLSIPYITDCYHYLYNNYSNNHLEKTNNLNDNESSIINKNMKLTTNNVIDDNEVTTITLGGLAIISIVTICFGSYINHTYNK